MSDVIAAVSTPFGRGGIAVIRISGDGAAAVADGMFRRASGSISDLGGGRTVHGEILLDGVRIDDGCATVFRAPHSYTGEDTVEISCHGGVLLTEKVCESAIKCRARPAEAGEFTRRAFVNGKIGLSEAEAVMDLIDAETEESMRLASGLASGKLGRRIAELRERIVSLISAAYVQIDYPDEDLSGMTDGQAESEVRSILGDVLALAGTFRAGNAVMHGVDTVICGTPNTGKSSLLNLLLGRDRAIVTPKAGTTRDTIEERAQVGRVTLNLCDTAGLRKSDDEIENMGIARARERLADAGLVLAVLDGSRPANADDLSLLGSLDPERTLIVINKSDLPAAPAPDLSRFGHTARISCATGEGTDELKAQIEALFIDSEADLSGAVVTNARQKAALDRASGFLRAALDSLVSGATADVAGIDLELAAGALGEADGAGVSADVVDGIFSRFCVGK